MDNDDLENVEDNNQESQTTEVEVVAESNNSGQAPSSNPAKTASIIATVVNLWKVLPITVKGLIVSCLGYVGLTIGILLLLILFSAGAAGVAQEFRENITGVKEKLGNFFTGAGFVTNQEEAEKNEQKYYKKLEQVAEHYKKLYNVEIDTTLITATLFYGRGMSDYIDDEEINNIEDNEINDEDIYKGDAKFYKLARRQIKTLAKFQIVGNLSLNTCGNVDEATVKITPNSDKELADTWTEEAGWSQRFTYNLQPYTYKSYVDADGNTRNVKLCDYEDMTLELYSHYNHDKKIYLDRKEKYDKCVKLASSDCTNAKEKMEEAYNAYYDRWLREGLFDENGILHCTSNTQWGDFGSHSNDENAYNREVNKNWIDSDSPPSFEEIMNSNIIFCFAKPPITMNYSTSTKREGVYYYELLSRNNKLSGKNFIEKYYPDYVSDTLDDVAMEDAIEVVEGIYDLYDFIVDKKTYALSTSNLCPNGVTVIAGTNDSGYMSNPERFPIGTFSLDEYIAMVLNGENDMGGDEAMKAQIIAARTYTLVRTDSCTKPIRNSDQDQVAEANPGEHLKELVAETSGMVLTYNGEIFLSEYDNFKATCSGDTCSGVYTKSPLGEKHTVTLPKSAAGKTSGHGRGMSQKAANYMDKQGKTYEEILKYFYSEGVEITKSLSVGVGRDQYPNVKYDHFDGNIYVAWGRNYIGNPYVFGGTSLTNGIDCSAFVQVLARELFDISLPRTSREQVHSGVAVASLEEARPGDLLFYNREWSGGRIGHVTIYAGNGMEVHAKGSKYGIVETPVKETPVAIRRIG